VFLVRRGPSLRQHGQPIHGCITRGERYRLAGWRVQIQQGFQATCGVERQPVADGMVIGAQELGYLLARAALTAGQEVEYLQPWFLATFIGALSIAPKGACICYPSATYFAVTTMPFTCASPTTEVKVMLRTPSVTATGIFTS
jgi:hypothetical protein